MNLTACTALTAILLVCPLVVLADEAADTFNKLYGEDLKRVAATPPPAAETPPMFFRWQVSAGPSCLVASRGA